MLGFPLPAAGAGAGAGAAGGAFVAMGLGAAMGACAGAVSRGKGAAITRATLADGSGGAGSLSGSAVTINPPMIPTAIAANEAKIMRSMALSLGADHDLIA